jgi:epsilon-lactone hydrolase
VLYVVAPDGAPAEWVGVPVSGDTVVRHLHGGGYAFGSIASCREFASLLARSATARVLLLGQLLAHPDNLGSAI